MEIVFATKRMRKICTETRQASRVLGPENARKLRQRLDDLRAAKNLGYFKRLPGKPGLPGRCHELKGDRQGQLSIDLAHPSRMILEPAHNPIPAKQDGGLDWDLVTEIRVVEVTDTHD